MLTLNEKVHEALVDLVKQIECLLFGDFDKVDGVRLEKITSASGEYGLKDESFYNIIINNMLISSDRLQEYYTWYKTFEALLYAAYPEVSIFNHGSSLQRTMMQTSDLDISFKSGNSEFTLDGDWPVLRITANDLIMDISHAGPNSASLSTGNFFEKVYAHRPDVRILCILMKKMCQKRGYYEVKNGFPGGIIVSTLILWALQRLDKIPVFERYNDNQGLFDEKNPRWNHYWLKNSTGICSVGEITDAKVSKEFGEILDLIIKTRFDVVFDCFSSVVRTNDFRKSVVILRPPSNNQNCAYLLKRNTLTQRFIPFLEKCLKEWRENPRVFLNSIL
uniref:Uncharacterized protein n=1 Tax=Panagrolaimus sp. ES5 TaxID=591445 RepID=A0AC34FQX3_9BILA